MQMASRPQETSQQAAFQEEEYYAKIYIDFLEMGMDGCAQQVLKEALAAHPGSVRLQELANPNASDLARTRCPPNDVVLVSPPVGMLQRQAPVAAKFNPTPRDVPGEQFWSEVRHRGMHALLLERGGLLRVTDVFPKHLAEEALQSLLEVDASEWAVSSSATVDYGGNEGTEHFYYSYRGSGVEEIKRRLGTIEPEMYPGFQAARYTTSGLIAPHDDSQVFRIESGEEYRSQRYRVGTVMYRKIAVICYLTKNWRREYGGCFRDLHVQCEPELIVPEFNSLVAFLVPRVHAVEELAKGCPPRLSVFGWFSDDQPYLPASKHGPQLSTMWAQRNAQ